MTPQEKAQDLFKNFFLLHQSEITHNGVWQIAVLNKNLAKKCVLISVDIIIFELKIRNCSVKYFEEVKQEIEKL